MSPAAAKKIKGDDDAAIDNDVALDDDAAISIAIGRAGEVEGAPLRPETSPRLEPEMYNRVRGRHTS